LLQDFEEASYGYTGEKGQGIQSTISSLSEISAHESTVRKARTADGLLVFRDEQLLQPNRPYNGTYDAGEEIYYTDYNDLLELETETPHVYICNYSNYNNGPNGNNQAPLGPYHVYERVVDGQKFVYVDRNNNKSYDASLNEKLNVVDQGYIGFNTVYGNNITFVEDDLRDGSFSFQNSINGRVTAPEAFETNSKHNMDLQCGDNVQQYMLWTISPENRREVALAANRNYNYEDGNYGGSKAYVSWGGLNSEDKWNKFFIFYSLNADGGYYMSPVDFRYDGSSEESNFRVIEIPAYNTPEMLTVADYNYGSNARFKISAQKVEKAPALELNNSSSLSRVENELYNVSAEQTVSDILSNFKNENAVVKNAKGETVDSTAKVGTGYTVELVEDDEKVDFVTVIILGDVSGDGVVNVTDYIKVKAALQNAETLSGAYKKASDVDGSGALDVTDYLKVKAHFLGSYNIYA
jgi:hypothetical protein